MTSLQEKFSTNRSIQLQSFLKSQKRPSSFRLLFSERLLLLFGMDLALAVFSVGITQVLWNPTVKSDSILSQFAEYWYLWPFLVGSWLIMGWLNNLYHVQSVGKKKTVITRVILTSFMVLCGSLLITQIAPQLPVTIAGYFVGMVAPLAILGRTIFNTVLGSPQFDTRVLIVGLGEQAQTMAELLTKQTNLNHKLVGYVCEPSDISTNSARDGLPVWDTPAELSGIVKRLQVDEIVIAIDRDLDEKMFEYLIECQAYGVRVHWMPDLYDQLCGKVPIRHIDATWAMHAVRFAPSRMQMLNKRLLDLAMVLFALPLLLIVFPAVALAIKLTSHGPIFYRQTRSGLAGQPFTIFKFRTMYSDAEKDGKPQWAQKNDPRITPIGLFLRKSHLDELPQLLNVLRGEMSFVGPRPERPEFIVKLEEDIPFYKTRFLVKPGLTGWAQINYDYGNTVEDAFMKLEYDFHYVRFWSIPMDIYTIFRTIGVAFRGEGM